MKRRWVDDCGLRGVALCPANLKKKIMIDIPVRDIRDNLVFSTDFRNFVGNDIKDQSGNIADMTNSGAVRKTGYGCGKSLSFDGSDDYCVQKVYDTQQGTVKIATVNGSAVLWDDGQDFTEFAGAAGSSKGYIAVVSDAEGEVAGGYIGEEGGGETLGSELHDDSNAAADPNSSEADATAGWDADPTGGSIASSSSDPNVGTYHFDINATGDGEGALADAGTIPTAAGKIYKLTCNVKVVSGSFTIDVRASGDDSTTIVLETTVNDASYTTKTYYWNALGTNERIRIIGDSGGAAQIYVDNLSVKEVTDFPANESIKLYSTKTGSTQNLAWNEASFDPNDTLTYEVRKSDFQITNDKLTLAAIVKPNGIVGFDSVIGKYEENNFSYRMGIWNDGRIRIDIGGISDTSTTTTDIIKDGQWAFIICVYNGARSYIYIDGKLSISEIAIGNISDSDRSCILGNDYGNFFKGFISEAIILNKGLTVSEAIQIYNYLLRKLGIAR